MLTQTGEVVDCQDGIVRVRLERFSGCGRCHLRHGCGAGVLARAFPNGSLEISLPATTPLNPGDRVTVGMREQDLLRAASTVYLLPLLGLLLGAGAMAPLGEPASMAGGAAGFVVGLGYARSRAHGAGRRSGCEPVLLDSDGNAATD